MSAPDNRNTFVFNRIADELVNIANEIEDLPGASPGEFSNEEIMRLQQIDFCSQKLRDIARMVEEFDSMNELCEQKRAVKLKDFAKLEYMQKLLVANG